MIKPGTVCFIDCCGGFIPQNLNGKVVTVTGNTQMLGMDICLVTGHWLHVIELGCPGRCLKPINPPGLDVTEKEDKPEEVPA